MVGLVLEGGGAKGAFHLGALKALLEEGYKFDGITGTSIGAINGAIIAQGDFEKCYKLWEDMDNQLIFDLERLQSGKPEDSKTDKNIFAQISLKIKNIIDNKGIDTSKIRHMLEDTIDEQKLRQSSIDFGMVSVSLSDFKPLEIYKEDIPQGKMIDYLMASANLPVFKIEPLDDKIFIDGGFYDNLPINLLIKKGYREIVAIRTNAVGVIRKIEDNSVKVTYITPSENIGSILDFNNDLVRANITLGYFDGMKAMKNLSGRKYYIEPIDEELFFNSILAIPQKAILNIGKILSMPDMEPRRMLFEKIFPTLARVMRVENEATYQDIVVQTLEYLAQEYKIERFQIMSFDEFINKLKEHENLDSSIVEEHLDFRKISFPLILGDNILKKVAYEFLYNLIV